MVQTVTPRGSIERPKEASRDHRPRHGPTPRRLAGLWFMRLTGLALLLILPARALHVLTNRIDPNWMFGSLALVSLLTAFANRRDKRKAQKGEWRTPESTLHFLELIGGWPAAFISQRIIRHKTAKSEYQFTFWLIVALHQYLSLDFVQGWTWSQRIFETLKALLEN